MTQKLNLLRLKLNQGTPTTEQMKEDSNAESNTRTSNSETQAQADGSSGPNSIREGHEKSRGDASEPNANSESTKSDALVNQNVRTSSDSISAADTNSNSNRNASSTGGILKGLKLGKAKSVSPTSPQLEADPAKPGAPDDDLMALAMNESSGVAPLPSVDNERFDDEIPATAPERKLPEGLDEQQQRFVDSLNGIYAVLSDPELFGQMIRNIMIELQQQPQYEQLLCDDDVAVMIRGMRESMNLARMRKVEKKRTTGGRSKKAEESNEVLDELRALAGDMGGLD